MSDLGELGLSSYEAKVYRALLGLGPATATEIAAASDVPRGRIYDVLNGLAAREIVAANETREPTEYAAVDPEEAAEVLLAERERDLDARRERFQEIAASVGEDLAPVQPTTGRFWRATLGSEAAVSLIEQQFAVAEERIVSVMSGPYANADVSQYERELAAIEANVRDDLDLRVLVSEDLLDRVPTAVQRSVLEEMAMVEARAAPNLALTVDVVDGETVFVHVTDPFGDGDRLGVVSVRDEAFAGRIEATFDDVWARAGRIESP